jgi:hypothetical protein
MDPSQTQVSASPHPTGLLKRAGIPFALFVLVYVAHFFSGVIASGDSRWVVPAAKSIFVEGNTNLDEYADMLRENDHYWVDQIDGHWYNRFPIGMTVLATPFVYVIDRAATWLFSAYPSVEEGIRAHCSKPIDRVDVITMYWRVELVIACFIIASAALFMYLAARSSFPPSWAFVSALVFAFATSAWSIGSRSLGQHGGSMLMMSMALCAALHAKNRPWLIQFMSLPLAFSYLIRPTNGIPILALTVYVLLQHRRFFIPYMLWTLPIIIPWLAYNLHIYHALFPSYYSAARQLGTTHFAEALAGLLVSPGRGLFIYSPVYLLSMAGVWAKWKERTLDKLDALLAATIVAHWIVLASFGDWWGGHSYGPRYFSDLTPFFVFLLFPAVQKLRSPLGKARGTWAAAFVVTIGISLFMHYQGAGNLGCWDWNREPVDVNSAPEHLWDWRDPPFLRGLTKGYPPPRTTLY